MEESCPVCQAPIVGTVTHCSRCGFPTALKDRLDGPLTSTTPTEGEPAVAPGIRAADREETNGADAEVNAVLARTLQERMELLTRIERDAPDATSALCEAALNEASGRVTEAQQILRSAQAHLDRETEELLAQHLSSLEARGQALEESGLRIALEDELGHLAESIVAGELAPSVASFLAAERRLDGVETHWRGLQALFAQVSALRQEAGALGIDLSGVPDHLEQVRASLHAMPATEHDLDVAAQTAAETLMRLHEAIPPALEQELARHAKSLETHPTRTMRVQSARRLHSDAVRHLKNGRLQDAVQSVRELRAELDELAKEAAAVPVVVPLPTAEAAAAEPASPPAGPPVPSPSAEARVAEASPTPREAEGRPGPEGRRAGAPHAPPPSAAAPAPGGAPVTSETAMLSMLTKKARTLAVRVRALPSESPEAEAAAQHIQEATELLRARRYAEADAALTRLMRVLAVSGSQS